MLSGFFSLAPLHPCPLLFLSALSLSPPLKKPLLTQQPPSVTLGLMTTTERTVAVVGGGISGLTTAYLLTQANPEWRITVLEKESYGGGKVTSQRRDGYTFDGGPNGFLTNVPETLELARSLGLDSSLQRAADAAKYRFIYKDGGLRPLPASPPKLVTTDLLSPFGKLRAAAELFLGEASEQEETVYGFLRRHFGAQVADTFAGVAVLGTTAGDAKALSLDAPVPEVPGARARARQPPPRVDQKTT